MKRNIRLTIEYDGSRYQGWQRLGGDSNANTIQGKLESVLSKMTGENVNINGLGKFYVKVKPPRTITNNLSGKEVLVDQKFSVAFRGSKKLAKEIG